MTTITVNVPNHAVRVSAATVGAPGVIDYDEVDARIEEYLTDNPPAYGDLTGTPTLGTAAAANVGDFATAAQGAKADSALQAADITGKLDTSAAPELIRDTMGTALVAGTNVTITVNDAGDTITIADTVSPIASGSASNPHTTQAAARNASLPKNFWQYTGTAGVDDPDNWVAGDEWISA